MDEDNANSSSNWDESDEGYVPLWMFISVNVALILVTVVGNLMVILAYVRDNRIRQTVANIIILNLSATDLLVGIFIFAPNTLWRIHDAWVFGTVSCRLWLVVDYSLFSVSTFTVVFISLDRYWLVTKGLAYSRFQTPRLILVVLAAVWTITILYYACIAFVAPLAASHESEFDAEDCELEVVQSTWFNIFEVVVLFMTPFSALVFLNGMVYHNILKRSRGLVATKRNLFGDAFERTLDDTAATAAEERNPTSIMMEVERNEDPRRDKQRSSNHDEVTPGAPPFSTHTRTCVAGTDEAARETGLPASHDTNTCHTEDKNGFEMSSLAIDNMDQKTNANSTQTVGMKSDALSPGGTTVKWSNSTVNPANNSGPGAGMEKQEENARRKKQYRRDKNELKRHRKAAITLAAIVFVYCLCCLPYFIYAIVVSLCKECVSYRVWEIVAYLQWSKSTINPFIYGFTNLLFRRNFAKFLLVHKCSRTHQVGPVI